MVPRSNRSTRRPKTAPPVTSYPNSSNVRRGDAPLHRSYHTHFPHSNRGKAKRRRPRLWCPKTSLLHKWSTLWIKGAIPTNSETTLRNTDHLKEAVTLLRRVQDISRHRLPTRWHLTQQRCDRSYLKMGSQTRSTRAKIHAKNSDQVSSPSRLPSWMERKQILAPSSVSDHWTMYFDESLKLGGGGAGVLFISPKG